MAIWKNANSLGMALEWDQNEKMSVCSIVITLLCKLNGKEFFSINLEAFLLTQSSGKDVNTVIFIFYS